MIEDSQVIVPEAFVALFKSAGTLKLTEPWDVIATRSEFCEDLARRLSEAARQNPFELGLDECDVLERVHRGLLAEGALVSPAEARWVMGRLAELLDWTLPRRPSTSAADVSSAEAAASRGRPTVAPGLSSLLPQRRTLLRGQAASILEGVPREFAIDRHAVGGRQGRPMPCRRPLALASAFRIHRFRVPVLAG